MTTLDGFEGAEATRFRLDHGRMRAIARAVWGVEYPIRLERRRSRSRGFGERVVDSTYYENDATWIGTRFDGWTAWSVEESLHQIVLRSGPLMNARWTLECLAHELTHCAHREEFIRALRPELPPGAALDAWEADYWLDDGVSQETDCQEAADELWPILIPCVNLRRQEEAL